MSDERRNQPAVAADEDGTEDEEHHFPKGALLFMVLFLVLIVVVWVYTYSILLGRG